MLLDIMQSSSGTIVVLLIVSLIVAGLMKGIIGVGMPIVAIPLLSMFIDVRAAVMLLSVPLILSNIPQALEGGQTFDCFVRLLPVLLGMMPGIFVGVLVLLKADPAMTKAIAGIVVMVVAMLTLLAPRLRVSEGMKIPVG